MAPPRHQAIGFRATLKTLASEAQLLDQSMLSLTGKWKVILPPKQTLRALMILQMVGATR